MRVSNFANYSILLQQMQRTQQNFYDSSIQIATEKKTQVYSGIADQSQRVITMENTSARIEGYIQSNEILDTRFDVMDTALESVTGAIQEFNAQLLQFPTGEEPSSDQVQQLQSWAFQTLKDIEAYLNSDTDGQYVFSGSSVDTKPVDLGLTSLETFQTRYDGQYVTFPQTRDAHLENFEISSDPDVVIAAPITSQNQWVDFTSADGRITIPSGNPLFQNINPGATIEITNTPGGVNDGIFTVKSVGNTINLSSETTLGEIPVEADNDAATLTVNGTTALTTADYGDISFTTTPPEIVATTGTPFAGLTIGDTIEITSHPNAALNGLYYVEANATGTNVQIRPAVELSSPSGPTLNATNFGELTFDNSTTPQSIATSIAGSLSGYPVGSQITVANSDGNDDTYIISQNDGTTIGLSPSGVGGTYIEIEQQKLTTETTHTLPSNGSDTGEINASLTINDEPALTSADYGLLTIDGVNNQLVAEIDGAFRNLKAGDIIEITDHSDPALNGKYLVEEDTEAPATTVKVRSAVTIERAGTGDLTPANFGNLSFDPANAAHTPPVPTVTASQPGAFTDITAGDFITIKNSLGNDDTYEVLANDGTELTLATKELTDNQPAVPPLNAPSTATIKAVNYYSGDNLSKDYNISDTRAINVDINAIDPGFEKAIRALSVLAQGEYGTPGGLDQNLERVNDALYLLKDAINNPTDGPPPYGTEVTGSIEFMQFELGFAQKRIVDVNQDHRNDQVYYQTNIGEIENVDRAEAIVAMQDQAQALEATYQVFARVQQMSLSDYIN